MLAILIHNVMQAVHTYPHAGVSKTVEAFQWNCNTTLTHANLRSGPKRWFKGAYLPGLMFFF